MSDKFENPNFTISQSNLDLVEKKERANKSVGGMTSSWTSPPDPSLIPPDKMELVLKSREAHPAPAPEPVIDRPRRIVPMSNQTTGTVVIPKQAMKTFQRLFPLFESMQVCLTDDQRKMFLESLQGLKTPPNMMDAKAIFNLIEVLS